MTHDRRPTTSSTTAHDRQPTTDDLVYDR